MILFIYLFICFFGGEGAVAFGDYITKYLII